METVRIEFPIKGGYNYDESKAVAAMVDGLKKLIEFGALKGKVDDFVQNYEIANPGGYAVAIIDKNYLVDASKLNSVGASTSLSYPVDMPTDEILVNQRQFSATTINERLRLSQLNPKMKFRYTILDFKKYYKANQTKLKSKPILMKRLKDMFIVDMMGMFNDVLPEIQEGKQLATLTGLTSITDGMNVISKDLSMAYRKALKQARGGQISPSVFKTLQAKYTEFMNILITQVFPGIEEINLTEATKTHSKTTSGTVTIQTSNPDKLHDLITYIQQIGNGGHTFNIVVDPDDKEYMKKFEWDGDGSDKIQSVTASKSQTEVKTYSTTSDGRLKLFE